MVMSVQFTLFTLSSLSPSLWKVCGKHVGASGLAQRVLLRREEREAVLLRQRHNGAARRLRAGGDAVEDAGGGAGQPHAPCEESPYRRPEVREHRVYLSRS